jgi:hypothetical protein
MSTPNRFKITPEMLKAGKEHQNRFIAFRDELEARYGPEEVAKACLVAIDIDLRPDIERLVNARLEEERAEIFEEVIDAMEDQILVCASLILKEQ